MSTDEGMNDKDASEEPLPATAQVQSSSAPSTSKPQPSASDIKSGLKPAKDVHKCLLSSAAQLIGEFESSDLLITHSWREFLSPAARWTTSPTFLAVAFRVEEQPEELARIHIYPNYFEYGNFVAACLSVFFGKQFQHHGFIETLGQHATPRTEAAYEFVGVELPPFSNTPRPDGPPEFKLDLLNSIVPLLERRTPQKETTVFETASGFYSRALGRYLNSPDAAFVDFVTAGEVLSAYYDFPDSELFDSETLELLDRIRTTLGDGPANNIRKRLYQLKKRYTLAISRLLDDAFFERTENRLPFGSLKRDSIEKTLGASYDLRSKYLHEGLSFPQLHKALEQHGAEKIVGQPIVEDKRLKKTLTDSPTLIGLERIVRYALLRFMLMTVAKT